MQNLKLAREQRALDTILADELYYTITLITLCANSFAVGILIGWLATI